MKNDFRYYKLLAGLYALQALLALVKLHYAKKVR